MTPEQLATIVGTIVTNVLTGGGLAVFLYYLIKGLKKEISTLNTTIEQQNKTLEVMEKRVLETEKVGNIYRDLVDDLPQQVEKYKAFINKMKDDVIQELAKSQDQTVKETRQLELKKLELQEQMLSEIPKLRQQVISAFEAIDTRIEFMNAPPFRKRIKMTVGAASASLEVPSNLLLLHRRLNSEDEFLETAVVSEAQPIGIDNNNSKD